VALVGYWKLNEVAGFGPDLVANGGFEAYPISPGLPTSWSNANSAAATREREDVVVRSGLNALKVTSDGTGFPGVAQNGVGLVGGKSYYAEAYGRSAGGAGEQPAIRVRNTQDAISVVVASGQSGGVAFEKLRGTFHAISGKTYQMQCIHEGAVTAVGEVCYFDDASLKEIRAEDASGGSRHGNLRPQSVDANVAGPTIGVQTSVGLGYHFDNSEIVEAPAPIANMLRSGGENVPCTLLIWWEPRGATTGGDSLILGVPGGNTGLNGWTGNGGFAVLARAATSMGAFSVSAVGAVNVPAFYAMKFDPATRKVTLLKDGGLVGSVVLPEGFAFSATSNLVRIGNDGSTTRKNNGVGLKARIYDHVMTDEEVRAIYAEEFQALIAQQTQRVGPDVLLKPHGADVAFSSASRSPRVSLSPSKTGVELA
jgi:hypothetical protein